MTYNPKIKNTAANKVRIDADLNAYNINLGKPEDNDDPTNITDDADNDGTSDPTYKDGLFKDFNDDFTVGYAIDRINEVLAKLAPPPAPILDSLNSNFSSGQTQYLAISDETSLTQEVLELKRSSDDPRSLGVVNGDKGLFEKTTDGNVNGTKYKRLGVIATKQAITLYLNGTVAEDKQGDETNYPNFAYNTTETKPEPPEIEVYLNDLKLEGDFVVATTVTNQPATFASGKTFDGFVHSVTTVTLQSIAQWRPGHNYVQVKYKNSATSAIESSYVDWVYVPDESTGPFTFTATGVGASITQSNQYRYISGIKYLKSGQNFSIKPPSTAKIQSYAKQSFPATFGVSIAYASDTGVVAGTAIETKTAGNLGLALGNVDVASKEIAIGNIETELQRTVRVLNKRIALKVAVNNNFGRTGEQTYTSSENYLYDDNFDNDGSIDYLSSPERTMDTFNHEGHRVTKTVGEAFSPSTTKPEAWDSQVVLADGNALVYNGRLYHPKYLGNTLATIQNPAQSGKDFSLFSQRAVYYRVFRKTDGANNNITFKIKYNGVSFGPANDSSKCNIELQRHDGQWLDACLPTGGGGMGQGTLLSSAPITNPSGETFQLAWPNGVGPTSNNYWLMRITMPEPSGTGIESYIEELSIVSS